MSGQLVSCPKCAVKLRLPTSAVPNSVMRCSKCATPFRVPAAAPKPAVKAAPAVAKPAPRVAATPVALATVPAAPKIAAQPITSGITLEKQNSSLDKIKQAGRKQWNDPKRRLLILGIGIGGAVMAAGLMLMLVLAVGFFILAGRGGSSNQVAQRNDGKPGNNGGANGPFFPVAAGPKAGVIKLLNNKVDPKPAVDPKNPPWLVTDAGGHSSRVSRVMFTPDAKQVISVSADKTIRIWNVATGETIRVLRIPIGPERGGSLFAGALSPDGKTLAVAGLSVGHAEGVNRIYLMSLESGQITRILTGHQNVIAYLEFSPDGKQLASASNDATARIWDVTSGKTVHLLQGHTKLIRFIRFSPDGKLAATVSRDESLRIWSMQTGRQQANCQSAAGKIEAVTWNLDGQIVAGGTDDGHLYLWDRNGRQQRQFKLHPTERLDLNYLTWTKNPNELLYVGVGYGVGVNQGRFMGRAGIFNIAAGVSRAPINEHDNVINHAAVSADGSLAVTTGGLSYPIVVWRTSDAKIVSRLTGDARDFNNVGWTPDGESIAWTNAKGGYFPEKGQFPPLRESFHLSNYTRAKLNPGARTAGAVLKQDGWSLQRPNPHQLMIYRFGQPQGRIRTPKERMISFTLLPKNRVAVGMDATSNIIISAAGEDKTHAILRGHTGMIMGLAPSPDGRYLASCSTDSTICIWSLDDYRLVMRLFITEQEWIAWTPEGYYACSTFGERLMGWHINNGNEKMATFHPAVRFRDSLYKPNAIKLLLKAGNIKQALIDAGGQQNGAEPVKLAQVLPPRVEITAPADNFALTAGQESVQVTAVAQSVGEHPVVAMRLLVDGRPYHGDGGHLQLPKPKLGQVQGNWNVKLPPGKHWLAVQAESAVSKAISPTLTVSRGSKRNGLPNLYVLAIGISEYPGKMALKFAAADAIAIEKIFKKKTAGVFAKVQTQLVTDSMATRKGVNDGLAWMKTKMTSADVGIIFFAGHGAQDNFGNFYLVPVDIRPGHIDDTCISGDAIKRKLANIPGRLIVMFDACHSGAAADKTGGFGARTDDLARDLVTEEYGIVVMCSSLASEYSMESKLTKHGFFTLGLVKGLEGHADLNKDRKIFVHEIDRFASDVVRLLSGGRQNTITSRPPTVRSFELARP